MRLTLVALLATLSACAAPERLGLRRSALTSAPAGPLTPEGRPAPLPSLASAGAGAKVAGEALAATAREFLGRKRVVAAGRTFPEDCAGLVRAVYAQHGLDLLTDGVAGDNGVTAIWRFAQRHGELRKDRPRPGDLVFFFETYDRNRDGRENDGLTHIGIVDRVDPDGTVQVIHRVAQGVVRYRMNLDRPRARTDAQGRVVNDWLREGRTAKLAGELFAAYGTLAQR